MTVTHTTLGSIRGTWRKKVRNEVHVLYLFIAPYNPEWIFLQTFAKFPFCVIKIFGIAYMNSIN